MSKVNGLWMDKYMSGNDEYEDDRMTWPMDDEEEHKRFYEGGE